MAVFLNDRATVKNLGWSGRKRKRSVLSGILIEEAPNRFC